jgi:hypothetical protein
MFTSHKGMVSSPKAIDFPKQRVRHGIYSNSFSSMKDLAWYLLSCSSRKHKSMEIGKHTQIGTWYLFQLSLC